MDLKAVLKKLGYTDEQIKGITDAMAENNLHVSSVENPEETIKQLQEERKKLEGENAELQELRRQQDDPVGATATEEIRKLQKAIQKSKIDTKLIVALTKANALDVDYLIYRAEKTGAMKDIKIDGNGNVTGVDELVESLKKSHAGQFETAVQPGGANMVRIGVKKLDNTVPADDVPQTLEEAVARKLSGDGE